MPQIRSESQFVWKFIGRILLIPITLIMVLFGRKKFEDLLEPFSDLWSYLLEAKITLVLICLNIAVFIWSVFQPEAVLYLFVQYPSDLFSERVYTLITTGFLHAGIMHLLGNMLGIFIFGRVVERKLGGGKTVLVYVGALILSGVFNALISLFVLGDNMPGVGASGALMGLVATAMLIDPLYFTYELLLPLPVMVVGWLTIFADIQGVLRGTQDGIGHIAHIGGFLSVSVLMYLLDRNDRNQLKRGFWINIGSIFVVGIVLFFV